MRKYLLRLGLPAIMALLLAFSTKRDEVIKCYGICGEDANYFYVCEDITNKELGVDYLCFDHPIDVCVVCTEDQPDIEHRIRKATSFVERYGTYFDLNPWDLGGKK